MFLSSNGASNCAENCLSQKKTKAGLNQKKAAEHGHQPPVEQRSEQLLRSLCCRLNTAPLRNWEFLKKRKIRQTICSKLRKFINILIVVCI